MEQVEISKWQEYELMMTNENDQNGVHCRSTHCFFGNVNEAQELIQSSS